MNTRHLVRHGACQTPQRGSLRWCAAGAGQLPQCDSWAELARLGRRFLTNKTNACNEPRNPSYVSDTRCCSRASSDPYTRLVRAHSMTARMQVYGFAYGFAAMYFCKWLLVQRDNQSTVRV
eukprot:6183120-Pleurochrysis_carterae.AAC.2